MTIVGQFYPTTEDVVNVYLRSLAGSCARKGIAYNVLPGSEAWLRARAIAAVVVGGTSLFGGRGGIGRHAHRDRYRWQ